MVAEFFAARGGGELCSERQPRRVGDFLLNLPLGLALGGNAPSEIAISIAAQLLQERDR
jgi:hypothetical protein